MTPKERRRAIRDAYTLAHDWIDFTRHRVKYALLSGAELQPVWWAAVYESLTIVHGYREEARALRRSA